MAGRMVLDLEDKKDGFSESVDSTGVTVAISGNETLFLYNDSASVRVHLSFVSLADVDPMTVPIDSESGKSPFIPPKTTIPVRVPREATAIYMKTFTGLSADVTGFSMRLKSGSGVR